MRLFETSSNYPVLISIWIPDSLGFGSFWTQYFEIPISISDTCTCDSTLSSLLGPLKSIFLRLCYIIKLILNLVLVAQGLFWIEFIGKNKVKIFNEVKFVKIVSHQKLLEKRKNLFFLDFSKFLSICQFSILVVRCFIQFERNSFNSKLRRISQMGCNQVCNIIACVNTREKI